MDQEVVAMILTGAANFEVARRRGPYRGYFQTPIEAMQRNGNERELGRGLEALPHYPG